MEVVYSSETSVKTYRTIRRHISEDITLCRHSCESLRSSWVRSSSIFRMKVLPPSSGLKCKPSKQQADILFCVLFNDVISSWENRESNGVHYVVMNWKVFEMKKLGPNAAICLKGQRKTMQILSEGGWCPKKKETGYEIGTLYVRCHCRHRNEETHTIINITSVARLFPPTR